MYGYATFRAINHPAGRETLYFLTTDAASIERSVGTKHAKLAGLGARCSTTNKSALWERAASIQKTGRGVADQRGRTPSGTLYLKWRAASQPT